MKKHNGKRIVDLRSGKIYDSLKEISNELKINYGTLKVGLHRKSKKYSHLQLLSEEEKEIIDLQSGKIYYSTEELSKYLKTNRNSDNKKYPYFKLLEEKKHNGKRIRDLRSGKIYDSLKEIANELKINYGALKVGLHRNSKKYSYLQFPVVEEKKEKRRRIIDLRSGIIYYSIKEMAEYLEINYTTLQIGLQRGSEKYSHFKFIEKEEVASYFKQSPRL